MKNKIILAFLEQHGVVAKIIDDKIHAIEVYTYTDDLGNILTGRETVQLPIDLTAVKNWLGY